MGERCVPIKFIRSACLPSKTWRVETSSFFFKNDHDKSSHQLSLRFQRHRCSPELDECQMGRRRRVLWSFCFWEMCRESRIMSSWNQGCSFHQCWLPFVSRVAYHSRYTEHPSLVTNELRMCLVHNLRQSVRSHSLALMFLGHLCRAFFAHISSCQHLFVAHSNTLHLLASVTVLSTYRHSFHWRHP